MFSNSNKPKNKSQAVLMAFLFGFATWAYTYREDKKKFWLATILSLILTILVIVVMISLVSDFSDWTLSIGNPDSDTGGLLQILKSQWLPLVIIKIGLTALWLWPIIAALRRPKEWYKEYDEKLKQPAD